MKKGTKGLVKFNSGSFKKGQIPWNKNTKGIMKGFIGKHTEKTKEKIRQTKLENPTRYWLGKKRPDISGENHYLWSNGKSFEPYGLEFNNDLKEVIRNRDRRKCQICEKTELENKEKLIVHHIDFNKRNNNPNNLISLCRSCHAKTTNNKKRWINYFKLLTIKI